MRKILLITILLFGLLLSACTIQQERDAKAIEEVFGQALACEALPRYDGREEYDVFWSEYGDKLPKNFFTWDDVSVFGEVCSMIIYKNDTYCYQFENQKYSLTIRYSPSLVAYQTVSTDTILSTSSGMREISNDTGNMVMITRNGYQYKYDPFGDLSEIFWYADGMQFSVSGGLLNYPEDKSDTIVGKLLSADDAVANAAFAEITQKLSK